MRALLVIAAAAGVALSGCGTGPASVSAGTTATADPQLRGVAVHQPSRSAVDVARSIAARWSAVNAPALVLNIPIEFRTIDYTATVFNPGSAQGFTAFITTRRTTVVTTASAAQIVASNAASARFATPADQAMWQAADRPSLGEAPAAGATQTIPAGQFTFLPQGRNLTYRQATALPADRDRLAAVLASHLSAYAGQHPPTNLQLKQVAYLIAMAPLTNKVRAAAWQVIASLPGLGICRDQSGQADPGAIELCIDSGGDEILVNVNPDTGAIVSIADRLTQSSSSYPHVAAGTIVGSSAFLAS